MGEGGQNPPDPSPDKTTHSLITELPEVHKLSLLGTSHNNSESPKPPTSLCTGSNISITADDLCDHLPGKHPLPESPVIYAVPNGSQLSTPSNSPAIWRLDHSGLTTWSSVSSMHLDYQCMRYPHHVPSPVPNTSNITGADSSSMVLTSPLNFDTKSNLTDSTSAIVPICRICHMPGEESEILISPCRCAGTLQFIHNTCLMKWLAIMSKHSRKPPKCELCHFQYLRHKKFKFSQFKSPKISRQDRVLHIIFAIMMALMIGCAIATVMCFLSDKGQISQFPRNRVDLTTEEIITLSCGVLFFVSFFVAMSVQIKAKHTVYQLFLKFIMQNMEWEIDEYDKFKDSLYLEKMHKNSFKGPPAYV